MEKSLPIAKYHLVEVRLASRIRDGFYGNEALPGERGLAAEFGVARVTIRHALHRLEELGLVVRHQRRGTLAVSGRGSGRQPRILREHIDQFLDRGRPDQRKVLSFARTTAQPLVAKALALKLDQEVLRVVRLRSRGGQRLTYTEVFLPATLAHFVDRAALGRKAFIQVMEEAGVKIGAARQIVRAERASAEVAAALNLNVHEPILKIERIVEDVSGTPVQLLLGWYRADRFEIGMQLSRSEDLTRVWVGQRQ